jgi:hypothetical protein
VRRARLRLRRTGPAVARFRYLAHTGTGPQRTGALDRQGDGPIPPARDRREFGSPARRAPLGTRQPSRSIKGPASRLSPRRLHPRPAMHGRYRRICAMRRVRQGSRRPRGEPSSRPGWPAAPSSRLRRAEPAAPALPRRRRRDRPSRPRPQGRPEAGYGPAVGCLYIPLRLARNRERARTMWRFTCVQLYPVASQISS